MNRFSSCIIPDAAQAFNFAARKIHGEFAKLNEAEEPISWL